MFFKSRKPLRIHTFKTHVDKLDLSRQTDSDVVSFIHWYSYQRHFPDIANEDTMEAYLMMTMASQSVRDGFKKVYESYRPADNKFISVDDF